jgi:hypothetical protein
MVMASDFLWIFEIKTYKKSIVMHIFFIIIKMRDLQNSTSLPN